MAIRLTENGLGQNAEYATLFRLSPTAGPRAELFVPSLPEPAAAAQPRAHELVVQSHRGRDARMAPPSPLSRAQAHTIAGLPGFPHFAGS